MANQKLKKWFRTSFKDITSGVLFRNFRHNGVLTPVFLWVSPSLLSLPKVPITPKRVLHVQYDYFSSFNQSNHWFVTFSLTLPSLNLKLPINTLNWRSASCLHGDALLFLYFSPKRTAPRLDPLTAIHWSDSIYQRASSKKTTKWSKTRFNYWLNFSKTESWGAKFTKLWRHFLPYPGMRIDAFKVWFLIRRLQEIRISNIRYLSRIHDVKSVLCLQSWYPIFFKQMISFFGA